MSLSTEFCQWKFIREVEGLYNKVDREKTLSVEDLACLSKVSLKFNERLNASHRQQCSTIYTQSLKKFVELHTYQKLSKNNLSPLEMDKIWTLFCRIIKEIGPIAHGPLSRKILDIIQKQDGSAALPDIKEQPSSEKKINSSLSNYVLTSIGAAFGWGGWAVGSYMNKPKSSQVFVEKTIHTSDDLSLSTLHTYFSDNHWEEICKNPPVSLSIACHINIADWFYSDRGFKHHSYLKKNFDHFLIHGAILYNQLIKNKNEGFIPTITDFFEHYMNFQDPNNKPYFQHLSPPSSSFEKPDEAHHFLDLVEQKLAQTNKPISFVLHDQGRAYSILISPQKSLFMLVDLYGNEEDKTAKIAHYQDFEHLVEGMKNLFMSPENVEVLTLNPKP